MLFFIYFSTCLDQENYGEEEEEEDWKVKIETTILLFLEIGSIVISDKSLENDFGTSRQEVFCKKGVLKKFATELQLY